jgi:hypothetical protein
MTLNQYIKELQDLATAYGDLEVVEGQETARSRQFPDAAFEQHPVPARMARVIGIQEDKDLIVHINREHTRKAIKVG